MFRMLSWVATRFGDISTVFSYYSDPDFRFLAPGNVANVLNRLIGAAFTLSNVWDAFVMVI